MKSHNYKRLLSNINYYYMAVNSIEVQNPDMLEEIDDDVENCHEEGKLTDGEYRELKETLGL